MNDPSGQKERGNERITKLVRNSMDAIERGAYEMFTTSRDSVKKLSVVSVSVAQYGGIIVGKMSGLRGVRRMGTPSLATAATGATSLQKRLSHVMGSVQNSMTPRMSIKEQAFFAKRLSFLIKAGIPLMDALLMLREQTRSRNFIRILDKIVHDVSNGQFLSRSLGNFRYIFGEFAINVIKVGESSGILSQNLEYLADELRKKQNLRRKVIGALAYPILITFATIGITLFLMIYLFPKIMPVFTSLNMKLPVTTRIVISVSTFLQHWGLPLFLGIAVFAVVFTIALRRIRAFHHVFDLWTLQLPIVGSLIREYNLANTTRTLGLMLRSGINLSEALPITADTTKNLVFKGHFREMSKVANKGEQLSQYLRKHGRIFPEVMSQMVAVGEKSGSLSHTLMYLSEMYETEVEDFTKDISTLIEPALMICMGVVVGFIAISIITPIYGITQQLHG